MWLKIIILVLFVGIVASLSSGLRFLLKDAGIPESKRTLYALGIRICLATLMMALIFYGYATGILTGRAPWDTP